MKRQHVLNGPVAYNAIVDESALRRGVGGAGVIRSQLAHLQDIGTSPNITIQIVAFGTGAYPGLEGPFELMTLPEPADFSVAIFDNPTGRLFVERDDAVRHHRAVFEHLRAMALSPDASQVLIGEIASSL